MSHYEKIVVTPNGLTGDATQYNFVKNSIEAILPVSDPLSHSLATEMMPDASKFYVANLLDNTITAVDMKTHHVIKHINLIEHYDPVGGVISGPVGALTMQTPVSPDGKNMVTANTLTGTITIVDTRPGLLPPMKWSLCCLVIQYVTVCNMEQIKAAVTMPMCPVNFLIDY